MIYMRILFLLSVLFTGLLMYGCDNEEYIDTPEIAVAPAPVITDTPSVDRLPAKRQFNIGNTNYLFDVSDHSLEELRELLERVDEISQLERDQYDDLEIVMILHGPDIEWFREDNYEQNRQLVDLAAKLDAYEVIDMKVCEMTLNKRGVDKDDIPAFIESVPFAPDEFKRLTGEGYINL